MGILGVTESQVSSQSITAFSSVDFLSVCELRLTGNSSHHPGSFLTKLCSTSSIPGPQITMPETKGL